MKLIPAGKNTSTEIATGVDASTTAGRAEHSTKTYLVAEGANHTMLSASYSYPFQNATVTVAIPSGSTLESVYVRLFFHLDNDHAGANKIDAWRLYCDSGATASTSRFTGGDICGTTAQHESSQANVLVDVSDVITAAGQYAFSVDGTTNNGNTEMRCSAELVVTTKS